MKRFWAVVAVALLGIMILGTGSLAAEKIRIGVSIPTADHGWTGGIVWWAQRAIKDWQEKDPNIEFHLVTADAPPKQVADVEDLMAKGIHALVILPHDSAPLTPICTMAHQVVNSVVVVARGLGDPVEYY